MNIPIKALSGAALALTLVSGAAFAQGKGPANVAKNCQAEIAKYCADVPHGNGQVPVCLKKHDKDLSATCKAALARRGPGRMLSPE